MRSTLKWLCLVTLSCLPLWAAAEAPLPQRGMNMTDVALHYGEPEKKLPAVGQPPIVRWVYPQYTVYFQDDYVINSVATVSDKSAKSSQP